MFFQYSWYSLTDWIRLNTSTETNQNSQASILIGGQQLSSQCANFLQGPCHLFIAFCSNFNQSFTVPNPFQLSCRLNTRKSQISSKQELISSPCVRKKQPPQQPPVQIATPSFLPIWKLTPSVFGKSLTQGTKKATVSFPSHPLRMSFVKTGCLRSNGFDQTSCEVVILIAKNGWWNEMCHFLLTTWVHRKCCFAWEIW